MEQLVARWAHNPKVVGSSPAPATIVTLSYLIILINFSETNLLTDELKDVIM